MPRDLSDVLDYFLPEAVGRSGTLAAPRPHRSESPAPAPDSAQAPAPAPGRSTRPPALPIVALPIGDQDVVRAAFAWLLIGRLISVTSGD